MHKLLLLVLGAVVTAKAQDIKVSYDAPVLQLLLPLFDRSVEGVVFSYGYGAVQYQAKAIKTSEGWEYRTEVKLGDRAYVYADAYYQDGSQKTVAKAEISTASSTSLTAASLVPLGRIRRAVVFRDDFNAFETRDWKYEVSMFGGMNWEFQVYTPDERNVYTSDGHLRIRPTLTADDPRFDEAFLSTGTMDVTQIWGYCTNNGNYGCTREGQYGMLPPIESGKVISIPTLRYGEIEVRARIPRGDWIWPAIWMMPKDSVYGGWPRSGEIDIMESRGNECGDLGPNQVSSTLHWGPAWDNNKYSLTHGEIGGANFGEDFHTWRLDWRGDHLRTYVDDRLIMDVDPGAGFWQKGGFTGDNLWAGGEAMAPFDQDFYLMFNVAVGGTNGFFPDDAPWCNPKPWPNNSPHANEDFWKARGNWLPTWKGDNVEMWIDYVEFRS